MLHEVAVTKMWFEFTSITRRLKAKKAKQEELAELDNNSLSNLDLTEKKQSASVYDADREIPIQGLMDNVGNQIN